ncbi:MAG: site-specific integrase, partial [Opitutaceae bacterium]
MNQSPFVVSRFQNRNGSFSWRVDGRLSGVRIRRNFKTQEEASAEKATLEIKAAQIESGRPNQIVTFLTLEQVRDAEAAFRRLQAAGISLLFCADFTLANYSKPAGDMALADAAKAY